MRCRRSRSCNCGAALLEFGMTVGHAAMLTALPVATRVVSFILVLAFVDFGGTIFFR
jgi:hypothetical protein